MAMDRYIEVIGEGQYVEQAARFVAEIAIEARATKQQTAVDGTGDLWQSVLAALDESGIEDDEVVEGGTDLYEPWFWRKKAGSAAIRKIILKVADFERLNRALGLLEPLQKAGRKSITIDMRQPEFDATAESKTGALKLAYVEARQKATQLVEEMDATLGKVVHVEEGQWSKRASGFSGDADWWGDSGRFGPAAGGVAIAGAPGEDESQPIGLQNPTRTIYVKCRVRFELV
jgi:uncharacterized protein YggE